MSFWDPRSDDDQVQISSINFYGDQLVVGFVGGSALQLSLTNQSSTVIIPLHRVSILREDPRQRGRNWQAPMELRLDSMDCDSGYHPTSCISIYPNVPVTVVSLAKEQKMYVATMTCVSVLNVQYAKGFKYTRGIYFKRVIYW